MTSKAKGVMLTTRIALVLRCEHSHGEITISGKRLNAVQSASIIELRNLRPSRPGSINGSHREHRMGSAGKPTAGAAQPVGALYKRRSACV